MAPQASHYIMRAGRTTVLPNGMSVESPGRLVPLIAVDQLPDWLNIIGVPRQLKPSEAVNMIAVGSYSKTDTSHRGSITDTEDEEIETFQVQIKNGIVDGAPKAAAVRGRAAHTTCNTPTISIIAREPDTGTATANASTQNTGMHGIKTRSNANDPFVGFSSNNSRNSSIPTVPSQSPSIGHSSASSDDGASVASTTCSAALGRPNVSIAKKACDGIAKKYARPDTVQVHHADNVQYGHHIQQARQTHQVHQAHQAHQIHQAMHSAHTSSPSKRQVNVSRNVQGKMASQPTQQVLLDIGGCTANDEFLEEGAGVDWDHWPKSTDQFSASKGGNNGPEHNKLNNDLGKFWGGQKKPSKSGRKAAEPRACYCRHFLRHGRCSFGEGCKYVHDMPPTLQALKNAGLSNYPSWWLQKRDKTRAGSKTGPSGQAAAGQGTRSSHHSSSSCGGASSMSGSMSPEGWELDALALH